MYQAKLFLISNLLPGIGDVEYSLFMPVFASNHHSNWQTSHHTSVDWQSWVLGGIEHGCDGDIAEGQLCIFCKKHILSQVVN